MKTILQVSLLVGSFILGGYALGPDQFHHSPTGLLGVVESVDYSAGTFVVRLTRIPKATRFYFQVDDPEKITELRPKEWVDFKLKHSKTQIKKVAARVTKIVWTP